MKPACKERLYLNRRMFRRSLQSAEFKNEQMLLKLETLKKPLNLAKEACNFKKTKRNMYSLGEQ